MRLTLTTRTTPPRLCEVFADISTLAYTPLRLFVYLLILPYLHAHTLAHAHIAEIAGSQQQKQARQVGKCMCNAQKQYIHEYIQAAAGVSQNSQNTA